MKTLEFVLALEPVAWQRVKRNRWGATYVPRKTRHFKARVRELAEDFVPARPIAGAISLSLTFVLRKPKRTKHPVWPIVRPDTDNYIKGVLDALNELFWLDDSQVVKLEASKIYATDTSPEIRVRLSELPWSEPKHVDAEIVAPDAARASLAARIGGAGRA